MRRIYQTVDIAATEAGYEVVLDGKPLLTPAKNRLVVPGSALAESIAEEWRRQGDRLDLLSMGHTQLANTAIDRIPQRRPQIVGEIVNYAGTDLVCYRASEPDDLAQRQRAAWQPLVDWSAETLGARLTVTECILPVAQPKEAVAALLAAIEAHDDMRLAGLQAATAACGSVVIGLALASGRLDATQAFAAAQLDEIFQMELWGTEDEAAERQQRVRVEIEKTAEFLAFCRA